MNENTPLEVIEIGKAQEIILGVKGLDDSDEIQPQFAPDSDLDE